MGHHYSKPDVRFRAISREINALKSSLRTSRQNITKEKKKLIVDKLAQQSSEVSSMNGKVKRQHMEETLRSISEAMEEVLKIEPSELDGGTVESDSFVNVPLKRERAKSFDSQGSSRNNMSLQAAINRRILPSLEHIEAAVGDIKSEINNAIDNQNGKKLKVFSQNLKSLAADLELIPTKSDIAFEKRKDSVFGKIMLLNNKVNKALNGLTKYENSKLQRKAMTDLSVIEVHLVENQSLLDKTIKEKIPVDVATIRNNIMESNQKLASIDLVDSEVKEKVALLSQKITEILKTLDSLMAKREFNSKFSKYLETFERIVRNLDTSKNGGDTVNQLQRLRNSIENLEEINDTTKNRKTQLLSEINRQLSNINDALQRESDDKIIKKLVEDSVILRKKAQSQDGEHTIIDQFINYWDNVKSNFDVNCYSHLSLLRIDGMLGEMQQSINDMRIDIANKCDTNIPGNFTTNHSQSAPKRNSRRSYGSSRSLNQLDGNIIRTKAKIYNISTSTSHLENRENQHQKFSKIEKIKHQICHLKETINGSLYNNTLKDKLKFYIKDLDKFVKDSNKDVAARAALVSNEITELLYKVSLTEFKEQIRPLFDRVKNFDGTRYDKEFDEVKNDLAKMQLSLEHFNIPERYVSLTQEKGGLIEEVCSVIESLQEKGSHHKKYEGENVKHIKAQLHDLSKKVRRFSGTYKGVHYNNIERELNRLLLDAGEHVEEKVWSDEIAKEAEKLLKILEQRSHLTQSLKIDKSEEWESDDQVGMTKIKRDLFNIKKEIDRTPENYVNDFIGLQGRLDLVNLELSPITPRSNENLAKEKEICINEVQTLKNVVDAKVALRQKPVFQWPEREGLQSDLLAYPKNDVNCEIAQIENSFLTIKKEIVSPSNEDDHKYYKLAQDIKKLIEKLNRHAFIAGTDMHIKQLNTLREMQYYVEVLEKEVDDVNYVLSMEEKIDKLKNLFESEQKYDLQAMAKELQAIQKKLQEHQLKSSSEMLRSRKTSVQQMTDNLTQKLRKMEYSENQELIQETRIIEDSERKVRSFAPEILSFSGLKTDDKFYELNEATIRMIIVLDKLDIRNAELQKRRIKLLKELHLLGQTLDERAQQSQELVNLEQEMDNISIMINSFSNNNNEMKVIRGKMEAVKSQLQKLEVTKNLASRKNSCLEKCNDLFNKVVVLDNSVTVECKTFATITEKSSPNFITHTYRFTNHVANSKHDIINSHDALTCIARDLEDMATAVNATNDKNQLQDFDDTLTKYTIELQNVKCSKESPQYSRVMELCQKVENLSQYIEKKINDSDFLSGINYTLDEISNKMDTPLTEEQFNQLHEELVHLENSLGKIDSADLRGEKDACMRRIILCLQRITDSKGSIQSTHV